MSANIESLVDLKTVGQALHYCHHRLSDSDVYFGHGTDNAWDESVQLVLYAAGLAIDSSDAVLEQGIDSQVRAGIDELLQRRITDRMPLPYLTGRAWYAGLEFACDRRAIIPRSPIAELIVDGFQPWYSGPRPRRMLDLCCGGGCIGLASAYYLPELQVDLLDIDENALALAQENVLRMGLAERVTVLQSDVFSAVSGRCYDLIVSNPPYVNREDLASMPAEYHYEPGLALASGEDGLDLTRRIIDDACQMLTAHGLLIVEVGNSWTALEQAYPRLPFTWLEFENGGHGVFALTRHELQEYQARRS